MKTLDELKSYLEQNDWTVTECGIGPESYRGWELRKHSPAGDDFVFGIVLDDNVEQVIKEIKSYIGFWAREKASNPFIKGLYKDPIAIKVMLEDLAEAIDDYNSRSLEGRIKSAEQRAGRVETGAPAKENER